MASDEISQLADALSRTNVGDGELSYKDLGLKLDTAESVEEMVHEIQQYRGLRALHLQGNTFGVEAAQAIAKALESKDTLQRCYWSDMFTGRLHSEIPTALSFLGNAIVSAGARLTELDLSDNAFGPDGVKGIEQLLKSPSCHSLRKLHLNNCGIGIGGGKILAEALMEGHSQASMVGAPFKLRVFVAGRNRLENEGACSLAKAFQLMGSLEEVHLPQNGINYAGVMALASAMQHNPNLRVLNFNDNTFNKKGTLAMAEALKHLRNVQVINFGDCLVRSEGAVVLTAVLREGLPTLKELNLSFGEITEAAALVVAQAVMDKPHMERLDLNGNCLGEEGCEALKEAMENMDKGDLLASLSDDEGEPEDEDEDNENEERADNDERECCDDFCEMPELLSFLQCPSVEKLLQLGEMRSHLQNQVTAAEPHQAAAVFLKIGSLYREDPEAKAVVLETTDAVLKKLLSGSALQSSCFISSLLVRMGLLKGEGKVKKVLLVPGQLLCLEHAVQQEYFPKHHVSLLHTFITRNVKEAPTSCSSAREMLRSTLERLCSDQH